MHVEHKYHLFTCVTLNSTQKTRTTGLRIAVVFLLCALMPLYSHFMEDLDDLYYCHAWSFKRAFLSTLSVKC